MNFKILPFLLFPLIAGALTGAFSNSGVLKPQIGGMRCLPSSFLREIESGETGGRVPPSLFNFNLCYPTLPGRGPEVEELNLRLKLIPLFDFNSHWRGVDFKELIPVGRERGWQFFYSAEGRITKNDRQLLSVYYQFESYAGGAHPISYYRVFNWNRKEWRPLNLRQFLKPGGLEALLEGLLEWDKSHSNKIEWPEGVRAQKKLPKFVVTERGLLFLFDQGEVAPMVAGPIQLLYPFPLLKPLLNKEGLQFFHLSPLSHRNLWER
ncbi:MAG: DUF3298 domain-containing protein [Campylobacterales bacterium]